MIPRPVLPSCFAALCFAACGGVEALPPSPSPLPSPAPVAAKETGAPLDPGAATRATPSLVGVDPPAEAPSPALPAGPLPAYPGRFEPVPLPAGVREIVAVAGRGGGDVWMIAAGGAVLRWDGARTTEQAGPRCFADTCCGHLVDCAREPARCATPCTLKDGRCAAPVDFTSIHLGRADVSVSAYVYTGGLTGSAVEARRGQSGAWTCHQPADDGLIHPVVQKVAAGGAPLQFERPGHLVNPIGNYSLVLDGRRLPLPEAVRGGPASYFDLAARAPDDLWLSGDDGLVWHGNGLAWYPVRVGLAALTQLWVDGSGSVWALGSPKKEAPAQLVRLERDRDTWQRFPTPGADRVFREGELAFWLLGKGAFYRWEGSALRRAEAPLDLGDEADRVWLGPSGELWVVGADRTAKVKTAGGVQAGGAAFRLVPPPGAKP